MDSSPVRKSEIQMETLHKDYLQYLYYSYLIKGEIVIRVATAAVIGGQMLFTTNELI